MSAELVRRLEGGEQIPFEDFDHEGVDGTLLNKVAHRTGRRLYVSQRRGFVQLLPFGRMRPAIIIPGLGRLH